MKFINCWIVIILIWATPVAIAQQSSLNVISKPSAAPAKKEPIITDLGWMDFNRMEQETTKVNELAQTKTGTPLRRDLTDLDTLQRIINNELVAVDDHETQQALGVVLGNVMLADFPTTFEWKVYEDDLGRSRAICVKQTSSCLFPITMLSRRMEVGTKPDVKKVYDEAILLMQKHLPKLPYDGGIMYKLPRN